MSIRDELFKMALVGTERAAWSQSARQKLADFGLSTDGPEAENLLKIAAVFSRMERAGPVFQQAEMAAGLLCPPENWPVCSQKAARLLAQMLRGINRWALSEFFELAVLNKKRVPHGSLPEILPLFLEKKLDWKRLGPALGERGKWLAANHFDWKNGTENLPADFDWSTARLADRLLFLKKTRAENPLAAADFIQKSWADEPWETRFQFLKTLETGLSLADERLLESALSDKRKEIRRLAVQLLVGLGGSRLGGELADFLKKTIVFDSESGKIVVAVPENADLETARFLPNGLVSFQNPPAANAFVAEILACLPLEIWETHFEKSPAELLAFFSESDWSAMLVPMILQAAAHQNLTAWSAAAIRFWVEKPGLDLGESTALAALFQELPTAVFEEEISRALGDNAHFLLEPNSPLRLVLTDRPGHFWSPIFTQEVFRHLHFWLDRMPELVWNGHFLEEFMEKSTLQAAPGEADFIQKLWEMPPRYSPLSPRLMEKLLAGLAFRGRLAAAMA